MSTTQGLTCLLHCFRPSLVAAACPSQRMASLSAALWGTFDFEASFPKGRMGGRLVGLVTKRDLEGQQGTAVSTCELLRELLREVLREVL